MQALQASRALPELSFLLAFGEMVVAKGWDLHDLLAVLAGGKHFAIFEKMEIHSVLVGERGVSLLTELARGPGVLLGGSNVLGLTRLGFSF